MMMSAHAMMRTAGRGRPVLSSPWAIPALALLCALVVGCVASSNTASSPSGSNSGPPGAPGGTGTGRDGSSDASTDAGGSGSGGASSGGTVSATGGSSGVSASGGSAAAAGGAGGPVGCSVNIALVAPQRFNTAQMPNNLVSGPEARVRMRAQLANAGPRAPAWTWTVQLAQQVPFTSIPVTVTPDEPGFSTVEFPVEKNGQYVVSVSADTGSICRADTVVTVNVPGPESYLFRVTPASSAWLGIPPQEARPALFQSTRTVEDISLMPGTRFSIAPQDTNRRFIPAYVRVSLVGSGVAVEGYTATGPVDAFLLATGVYDVLIVPDDDRAPVVLTATAAMMPALAMDDGTPVTGRVVNGDGTPAPGARVVLRAGIRPSTIGTSDATGAFTLRTRLGVQSVAVIPPDAAGLPEARVEIDPGIAIDSSGTTLTMTWGTFQRAPFSIAVKASTGNAPVVGCRVRVESKAELAAGTLMVSGASSGSPTTSLMARGSVRIDVITDPSGLASFPSLPLGAYQVTVVPPASLPDAALTTTSVSLTAAGFAGTIPLARHVRLSGTLLPLATTIGMRVIARDQSPGLVAPLGSAIVGDQGQYSLDVAPGRLYRLVAEPLAGSAMARTVLGDKQGSSLDTAIGPSTVAHA